MPPLPVRHVLCCHLLCCAVLCCALSSAVGDVLDLRLLAEEVVLDIVDYRRQHQVRVSQSAR